MRKIIPMFKEVNNLIWLDSHINKYLHQSVTGALIDTCASHRRVPMESMVNFLQNMPSALEPRLYLKETPLCSPLKCYLFSSNAMYGGARNVGILRAIHCYLHTITSVFFSYFKKNIPFLAEVYMFDAQKIGKYTVIHKYFKYQIVTISNSMLVHPVFPLYMYVYTVYIYMYSIYIHICY